MEVIEKAIRHLESYQKDFIENDSMSTTSENKVIKTLNSENEKLRNGLNKMNEIINDLIVLKKTSITSNKEPSRENISSNARGELMELHIESMKRDLHMKEVEYKYLANRLKQITSIGEVKGIESRIEHIDNKIKQLRRENKEMKIEQMDRGKFLDKGNFNEVFDEISRIRSDLISYKIQIDKLESKMLKNSINLQAKNWDILTCKEKYERLLKEENILDVPGEKNNNEREEAFKVAYKRKELLEKNIVSYKNKEQVVTYDYKKRVAELEKNIDKVISDLEDRAMYFV